jgi:hypothetical protein
VLNAILENGCYEKIIAHPGEIFYLYQLMRDIFPNLKQGFSNKNKQLTYPIK